MRRRRRLLVPMAVGLLASATTVFSARAIFTPSQVAKLLPNDGAAGDFFGHSVAIDGDIAVVAATRDDDNGINTGSVYIFMRDPDTRIWTQQTKLLTDDGATGDNFGGAVAINGDIVVVGADGAAGSAYVFARNPFGAWVQQAKLLPNDGATNDNFGRSVAVSGDIVVVGADGNDDNGSSSGSAYVFTRNSFGVWAQQAKLLPDDGATGDHLGGAVAMSGDIVVVGADGNDDNGSSSGSAYVFRRNPFGVWTQQANLLPDDGTAGDNFGSSVAISGDNAVVGALGDDDNGESSGSAYVFVRDPDTKIWSQQAKLLPSDGAVQDFFGYSVDLNDDMAVVGAWGDDDNGTVSGSAYTYTHNSDDTWTLKAKHRSNDGIALDFFGYSVAVSGKTIVVGAWGDDDNGDNSGSAYVFDLCAADFNNDGVVNGADLSTLLAQWGTDGAADLVGDGVVNGADLAMLLGGWGPCP